MILFYNCIFVIAKKVYQRICAKEFIPKEDISMEEHPQSTKTFYEKKARENKYHVYPGTDKINCVHCKIKYNIINIYLDGILNNEIKVRDALKEMYDLAFEEGIKNYLAQEIDEKEMLFTDIQEGRIDHGDIDNDCSEDHFGTEDCE